ncbi:MAG: PorT family protein [Prevotella sp.]|nr:PorT family protein [Prevotella sp.]
MKKIMLVAALMLSSVATFAQHAVGSFNIQPKVGLNIANLTDYSKSDARLGLVAGAEGEYQATDIVSVSAGLLYSMQGAKVNQPLVTVTQKLDYINIPITANVYVVKGLAVKLGVQPGFKVGDVASVDASRALNVALPGKAKSFDLSIPVGVSYEYNNFQLDARYNWGVTKVYEGSKVKNSVFQITLGYKFDL